MRDKMIRLKKILGIAVIVVAIFSLLNQSMNVAPLMLLVVAAFFLALGAEEMKKGKRAIGYLYSMIAIFNLFVSYLNFS